MDKGIESQRQVFEILGSLKYAVSQGWQEAIQIKKHTVNSMFVVCAPLFSTCMSHHTLFWPKSMGSHHGWPI